MYGNAAYAAAIAQAIKASGAIVQVAPEDFRSIVGRSEKPLVVCATGGAFTKHYRYLTGYKGLVFFAKSPEPLMFSGSVELMQAKQIWIPG